MESTAVVRAWGQILGGSRPNLSIEITRECPLRCPGCYAYGDEHLGEPGVVLRSLSDLKGGALVDGVIQVLRRERPIHLSIIGGEPLVRYRELDALLPRVAAMGIHTQVVTSAVRPIPAGWSQIPLVNVSVSIDGLQPEHDARRAPATYDRILKHIAGQHVTIHCTLTRQQARPGYVRAFIEFWAPRPDVKRIWFSLYTPQRGEQSEERLRPEDRALLVRDIAEMHAREPKLRDMQPGVVQGYLRPPSNPDACIFAKTTTCLSADLEHRITPCQFGGNPECTECGCMASVGLEALGQYRLGGAIPLKSIFAASLAVGTAARHLRRARAAAW